MIDTIIFDLDGTLLDTLEDLKNSVNHALKCHGLPERTAEEVRAFLGNGIRQLVHLSVPEGMDGDMEDNVFHCFREYYMEHSLDATAPYAGVEEMLAQCRKLGYKTAIVSNKLDPAVKELHEHFFKKYVDVALGESADVRRKPAPDMVEAALDQLHSSKETSVYVGDSEVDILTAKNSGLKCISVAWGFRTPDFLTECGACPIICCPSELCGVVVSV